jgi:hypothetical protein
MAHIKLLTPQIKVLIGDYILTNGLDLECYSSRESHADWCSCKLSSKYENLITYYDMEKASVALGYEDNFSTIISGYIRKNNNDYWRELIIKDEMIRLERTYITATFLDAEPIDIIKYCLGLAAVNNYKLNMEKLDKKKVFSVVNKNVIDTITAMQSFWGINYNFFFQNDCFYWGTAENQELIYILEYGVNIIKMTKINLLWEIETIGIPWIHHSQIIEVVHPKYSGQVTIEKMIYKVDENGFARMYIYFRG